MSSVCALKLKLATLKLLIVTTSSKDVVHPCPDRLNAEVCVSISDKTCTLRFVGNEVILAIELLVKFCLLILIYPNNADGVIFIELKQSFDLVLE